MGETTNMKRRLNLPLRTVELLIKRYYLRTVLEPEVGQKADPALP
jgi:hypothetical protein